VHPTPLARIIESTLVPTILLESPKGPSDKKCLGPTKESEGRKINKIMKKRKI
jgi:hypothetical protein